MKPLGYDYPIPQSETPVSDLLDVGLDPLLLTPRVHNNFCRVSEVRLSVQQLFATLMEYACSSISRLTSRYIPGTAHAYLIIARNAFALFAPPLVGPHFRHVLMRHLHTAGSVPPKLVLWNSFCN